MERDDDGAALTRHASDEAAAVTVAPLGSAALARLIEEVRVGAEFGLDAYNRTYHRHNR